MPLFPFVQLEFTHSIGPPPGRYTVPPRDRNASPTFALDAGVETAGESTSLEEPIDAAAIGTADVLVIQMLGAPAPTRKRFRAGLPPVPEGAAPREVSVTVVTVVLATRVLADTAAAKRLMSSLKVSDDERRKLVAGATAIVRRAVGAYRLAAADPYVPDLSPLDARAVRVGYGEASAVARGGWSEAFAVPPDPVPRLTRTGRLMPVQAMAGMLAGTVGVLEAEELILAVVRDLDHGRNRAAAITLAAAQDLLLAELSGAEMPSQVATLVAEFEASGDEATEIATRAIADQLTHSDLVRIGDLAEQAGAVVDAWRYVPLGYG
jgi:hypothetical protein